MTIHQSGFVIFVALLVGCIEVGEDSETGCLVDMTGPGCQPDAGRDSGGTENAADDAKDTERH